MMLSLLLFIILLFVFLEPLIATHYKHNYCLIKSFKITRYVVAEAGYGHVLKDVRQETQFYTICYLKFYFRFLKTKLWKDWLEV